MATKDTGDAAWLPSIAIGCATGLLIHLALGNRVIPNADEGIYLQGGVDVLRSAVPYRDFFAITGPGSFWLVAAMFRIAGITLRSARVLLALDISVLVGLTYWITSRLARPLTALATSVLCAALFLSSPGNLVINHRWDSSAAMLAAIAFTLATIQSPRRTAAFFAGLFSAAAAWITPPTGLVGVVIVLRVWIDVKTRRVAVFVGAGILTGMIVPAWILAAQGGLVPMVKTLFWNASHYSAANRVPFGHIFGGPAALFAGAHGGEWIARILLAIAFLLPALLPPLVAVAWLPAIRDPMRTEIFLLAAGGAAVFSSYPRWDLLHLLYVSPVFLILAAVWVGRIRRKSIAPALFMITVLPAAIMSVHTLLVDGPELSFDSPAGHIRAAKADAAAIQMSLANIQPADTLFVYPYEPLFYFLTQAHNPTRYLWLQPGMMSDADERTAVSELIPHPPKWVLYRDLAPADYLRIWPGSDPTRLRMNLVEEFISANYVRFAVAPSPDGPRQLLKRRDQP